MKTKIRIGIDARMIRHSGIGTYLRNLLWEFQKLDHPRFEFTLFGSRKQFQDSNGSYILREVKNCESRSNTQHGTGITIYGRVGYEIRPFNQPIYSLSEQIAYFSKTRSVDLWHAPHYNAPFFSSSKLVVTIHDLIPLIFSGKFFSKPKHFYLANALKRISEQAENIIAVSECTKRDLVDLVKVPAERIRVIYEGVSSEFRPIGDLALLERVRSRYQIPKNANLILYVGLIKPHKNLGVLTQAVKRLRREGKIDHKLVIVGKKDRTYPTGSEFLAEIHSDEDIIYRERVEHEDLPALYNLASIFILPSLYEGFGLPVLEALACGIPVIVSNRASLPEVVGEAALLFEADSEESLAEAILKLARDEKLRQGLRQRGFERARLFSWNRMAQETLKVYEEASSCN